MIKRTTIEIDQELLERARKALGGKTTRSSVEEALRRVAENSEAELAARAKKQRRFLRHFTKRVDVSVLGSEEAWR